MTDCVLKTNLVYMASPLRLAVIRPRRLDALRAFTQSLVLPNSDELSLCYKQVRKAHVDMTRNDQFRRIASYRSMWRRQGGWLPAGRQAGCSKGINTKCLVPLISVINWCHKDRSGEEVKKKYFMMLGQMETRQDFCEEMCHIYNATYQLQVGKIHQPGRRGEQLVSQQEELLGQGQRQSYPARLRRLLQQGPRHVRRLSGDDGHRDRQGQLRRLPRREPRCAVEQLQAPQNIIWMLAPRRSRPR